MTRFVTIGECMVELGPAGEGLLRRAFAGDTFNMAYYARLALPPAWEVDYLSAVGVDAMSDEMVAAMGAAGIGTAHVARDPERTVGLYMIHLAGGERTFSYWRASSAARRLARDPARLDAGLAGADVVAFSGITLAILEDDGAEVLLAALRRARGAGASVAFDPNIRARLWSSPERMRDVVMAGARAASVLLPSFDDEVAHFTDTTPDDTFARYAAAGCARMVLKMGDKGAIVAWDGERRAVPAMPARLVDSTAAGDSFNGVFLARIAQGDDPWEAAARAAHVAARVVSHPGALVAADLLGADPA